MLNLGVEFNLQGLEVLVKEFRKPSMKIVEIGSWRGYSADVILRHIVGVEGAHLFCVDHWLGSPNTQQPGEILQTGENIYKTFLNNMFIRGYITRVTPIRLPAEEAVQLFPNHYVDFVFLDGDHAYTPSARDIDMWWPKLKSGGIFCGHDMECMYEQVPEELKQPQHWENDCVRGLHIGVIKAVCERFPSVSILEGNIWCVQKAH